LTCNQRFGKARLYIFVLFQKRSILYHGLGGLRDYTEVITFLFYSFPPLPKFPSPFGEECL
jgi:hypothetical protein